MKFYIEIDNKQKKYSVKNNTKSSIVIYQQNVFDTVVATHEHKDRIYGQSYDKCKDLDCTQFYTSAFVSGSVSQCGDCAPRTVPPRPPGNIIQRCSLEITMNRVFPVTEQIIEDGVLRCDGHFIPTTLGIRVLNSDSLETYNNYLQWLAHATEGPYRIQASRNGFWLGLPVCSGSFQCLLSCDSGSVAGCWNTSGGTGNFADVYNISGQNYQVYDAIQIALAGIKPNGGSFPLLSGNPLTGRTSSGNNCGTPITQTAGSNCLTSSGSSEYCEVDPDIGPPQHLDSVVGLVGDFRGKSFSFGNSCGYAGDTIETTQFALGGSNGSSVIVVTNQQVGITGVFDSCGACQEHVTSLGYGADCCQLSYGNITIHGAPSWNGSGWNSGGSIWNNFWSSNSKDNNFRVSETTGACETGFGSDCWGSWRSSCGIPSTGTLANSLGTVPCTYNNPTSNVSGCTIKPKQVSWWRYFQSVPENCEAQLVSITPGFVRECGACDNLDPCMAVFDVYGNCFPGEEFNIIGIKHSSVRGLFTKDTDKTNDPNQNGNLCFTPVPSGLGQGYLVCGDGKGQICCDSTPIQISPDPAPADRQTESGKNDPFLPTRCSGWFGPSPTGG